MVERQQHVVAAVPRQLQPDGVPGIGAGGPGEGPRQRHLKNRVVGQAALGPAIAQGRAQYRDPPPQRGAFDQAFGRALRRPGQHPVGPQRQIQRSTFLGLIARLSENEARAIAGGQDRITADRADPVVAHRQAVEEAVPLVEARFFDLLVLVGGHAAGKLPDRDGELVEVGVTPASL